MNSTRHAGKPSPERLAAAVEAVTARYDPEQVILFGSAARGTMTEGSDIDLMVITSRGKETDGVHQERINVNGERIDILRMTAQEAERHRRTAGAVQQPGLEEGIIVHWSRQGTPLVPVGQSWFTDEDGMVKSTRLRPDRSGEYLDRAEKKWRSSNVEQNDDETRCYLRHQTVEQCLKGVIIAQGRPFEHVHSLESLWTRAEDEGEVVRASRNDKLLEEMTAYAEGGRYSAPDPERDLRTLEGSKELCEEMMDYVREAIPRLTRDTKERLAKTPKLLKPSSDLLQGKK